MTFRYQSPARSRLRNLVLLSVSLLVLTGCQSTGIPNDGSNPAARSATNAVTDLHTQLGIGYLREGKLELAWERLDKALENDPDYSTANNAMGLLHEQIGKPDAAEAYYIRAVDSNPNDSSAQNNYGRFLCRAGRYEEGEQHLLRAVENPLYQSPQLAYANAGSCAKAAGDLEKAETYFRQSLELDPRLPVALVNMAQLTYGNGNYLSARAYLQRYLEVANHSPQSLWLGIQVENALGDRDAVASYGLQLKTRYPDSPETRMLLEESS